MSARWIVLAVLVAGGAALAPGCSKQPAPTAPVARLGPAVEEVFPPPRAVRVPLATAIWARFHEPLDPASIGPTTVFLKLDAARVRSDIQYDAATRTVRITPLETLRLRRTYTLEIGPRVTTAAGAALDSTYFWQFTTTALRLLEHPMPLDGASGQGPFTPLTWDAPDPDAGAVRFELYTAPDSAAVADHVVSPIVTFESVRMAPQRRALGSTWWWSLRATNLDTGEQTQSPLWRFTVVGPEAIVDSLVVPVSSFGSASSTRPLSPTCTGTTLNLGGGNVTAAIRWQLESVSPGLRLADAAIRVQPVNFSANVANAVVYGTTTDFTGCGVHYGGPPVPDLGAGRLAPGVYEQTFGPLLYHGDGLTSHLQCAVRLGFPHGYTFASDATFQIYSDFAAAEALRPQLRLYYYRDPPGATVAPVSRAMPLDRARVR